MMTPPLRLRPLLRPLLLLLLEKEVVLRVVRGAPVELAGHPRRIEPAHRAVHSPRGPAGAQGHPRQTTTPAAAAAAAAAICCSFSAFFVIFLPLGAATAPPPGTDATPAAEAAASGGSDDAPLGSAKPHVPPRARATPSAPRASRTDAHVSFLCAARASAARIRPHALHDTRPVPKGRACIVGSSSPASRISSASAMRASSAAAAVSSSSTASAEVSRGSRMASMSAFHVLGGAGWFGSMPGGLRDRGRDRGGR